MLLFATRILCIHEDGVSVATSDLVGCVDSEIVSWLVLASLFEEYRKRDLCLIGDKEITLYKKVGKEGNVKTIVRGKLMVPNVLLAQMLSYQRKREVIAAEQKLKSAYKDVSNTSSTNTSSAIVPVKAIANVAAQ